MARLEYITLHFNVFLLKLTPPDILRFLNKNFTFQCVSIKVSIVGEYVIANIDFTFQCVSIKVRQRCRDKDIAYTLHFNVFLLKFFHLMQLLGFYSYFTFQCVSIKVFFRTIHTKNYSDFTFQCVSIKVFFVASIFHLLTYFTFQCVSIKVRIIIENKGREIVLYISMCFY